MAVKFFLMSLLMVGVATSLFGDALQNDYDIGVLAYNQGQLDQAEVILGSVVQRSKNFPVAFFILGKIARSKNPSAPDVAERYFRGCSENSPRGSKYWINAQIMLSYTVTETTQAVEYAQEAYDANRNDPDSEFALAIALNRSGFEELNKRHFEEATKLFERSVNVPVKAKIFENKNNLVTSMLTLQEMGKPYGSDSCSEIGKFINDLKLLRPKDPNLLSNENRFRRICKNDGI